MTGCMTQNFPQSPCTKHTHSALSFVCRVRKTQTQCKQQVQDLAACFKANDNSRAKCFAQYVAFDTCTEEF